jgi:hypothetical protein
MSRVSLLTAKYKVKKAALLRSKSLQQQKKELFLR